MYGSETYYRFANRAIQYWMGKRLPFLISWYLTSKCQLQCKGCFFFARDFPKARPLTSTQRFDLLEQLIELKQPYLTLVGGEPFLCKDLFPIAERAQQGGITVDVVSNGQDISRNDLDKVDGRFFKIWISIDGSRDANDAMRGSGAWDRAMRTLRHLLSKRRHTRVCVSTILNHLNIADMPKFVSMLRGMGVDQVCLKENLIPKYRPEESTLPAALEQLIQIKEESPGFILQEKEFFEHLLNLRRQGHASCFPEKHLHIGLMPEGTVSACVSFPVPIGNVRDRPLVQILEAGHKERYGATLKCPGCTRDDSLFFSGILEKPWRSLLPGQAGKLLHTLYA
ncbi:MAG: 4Fe-4S cluster-binding domain-containing protein [Deltaproteobacteria bacterium]|nr:4Fe-4S cluster-binding domain-containing protein [Deltaproteobacteria bacterium]